MDLELEWNLSVNGSSQLFELYSMQCIAFISVVFTAGGIREKPNKLGEPGY